MKVVVVETLNEKSVSNILPKRPKDANKGTFGKVLIIAGSENFPGAAYFCCAASYRVGAGLVTLATIPEVKAIVSERLPEATFILPDEVFEKIPKYDVLLLGPGLGQKDKIIKFVRDLIKKKLPKTVIDGDGLNILAKIENWWNTMNGDVILTPHPGEMVRLTGLEVNEIQRNRGGVAQKFAKKWNTAVVLKGANTTVAPPMGGVAISPFANPALSTAGTGDVLAGIIAGLLAQGVKPFDASCAGVYVHGMAGEILKEKVGDAGVLASDLIPLIPKVLKQLKKI